MNQANLVAPFGQLSLGNKENVNPTHPGLSHAFFQAQQAHPKMSDAIAKARDWALPLMTNLTNSRNWQCISKTKKHPAIQFRTCDQNLELLIPLRHIGQGTYKKVKLKLHLSENGKSRLIVRYRLLSNNLALLKKNEYFVSMLYPNLPAQFKCIKYTSRKRNKERLLGHYFPSTLKKLLKTRPLENEEIIENTFWLAQDLDNLHSKGWCHLDINAQNICLDENNFPYLLDYDFTSQIGRKLDTAETNGNVAPEIIEATNGFTIAPSADVFSMGMLMVQMAHPPLFTQLVQAQSIARKTGKTKPTIDTLVKIQASLRRSKDPLDHLIVQLIAYNPSSRPTAREIINELLLLKKALNESKRTRETDT